MLDDQSFIHFVALKGSPIIPYGPSSSRPCAMAALNSLRRAAGPGEVAGVFKSPGCWLLWLNIWNEYMEWIYGWIYGWPIILIMWMNDDEWWFGTWISFFHIFGNSNPNWLIFFRGVETTNQDYMDEYMVDYNGWIAMLINEDHWLKSPHTWYGLSTWLDLATHTIPGWLPGCWVLIADPAMGLQMFFKCFKMF